MSDVKSVSDYTHRKREKKAGKFKNALELIFDASNDTMHTRLVLQRQTSFIFFFSSSLLGSM